MWPASTSPTEISRSHGKVIENLRAAARRAGRRVAIMADLSGPKIRIGQFAKEPVQLKSGDPFTLTTGAHRRESGTRFGHLSTDPQSR